MYDEYERALTGRSRRTHPIVWVLGIVAAMMVTGGAVTSVVGYFAYREARAAFADMDVEATAADLADDVARSEGVRREIVRSRALERAARLVVNAHPDLVLEAVDESGALVVRNVRTRQTTRMSVNELVEGRLTVTSGGRTTAIDFQGGPDGGSLVIDTEGERMTFDLVKGEEGGSLVIRGADGEARFEAGGSASEPPPWVPELADGERTAVFSGTTPEGHGGAVTWEVDVHPVEMVEEAIERLEDEGWAVHVERLHLNGAERQGIVVGEMEDRTVTVFVAGGEGGSNVVLAYVER